MKRKRVSAPKNTSKRNEEPRNKPEETIECILAENKAKNKYENKDQNTNKTSINSRKKTNMPPIVIDVKTANQNTLIQDIRQIVNSKFSIKHTNNSTILFVGEKTGHEKMVQNIRAEKVPFHTYTSNEEKNSRIRTKSTGRRYENYRLRGRLTRRV